MIVEYVNLLKSSYILTLSDVMINYNCFNDRDHSLLVLNEVSDSYLKLWLNCYFSIRDHMTKYIYVDVQRMIMMPSCPYCIFIDTSVLNMWTYFSISALAWGQARSKIGGVDTYILHHAFISIFIALWAVITHYVTILMPILSYFTRFTWRGGCQQLEFWAGKGANIRDLFYTTPKVLKLHGSQNIKKILGKESTRGGPHTIHEGGGASYPLAGLRCPSFSIWSLMPWKKS